MESQECMNLQNKSTQNNTMLPSQIMKRAESYWEKQALISECLKEAFILLSGTQLALRRENLLLNSATFPEELTAFVTVGEDLSLNVDREMQEKSHRLWLAGLRATSDMKAAQALFSRALELSILARKDFEQAANGKTT